MQRTLILVKPDGVHRGLIGEIISRFERRGLKLLGMKFMHMSGELAGTHYQVHKDQKFYDKLIQYITSGPVLATVWEGEDAIEAARSTMGNTNPVMASPGTIRGDFGMEIGRNLVHGSDSPENAEKEVNLFFDAKELVSWVRDADTWIRE